MSANTTSGFSIVNWNGTEASATVAHGLSQAPEIIIVKDVDSARSWPVNTENTTGTSNGYLLLDTDAAQADSSAYWGAAPGASVFTLGDSANTNDDASMIAYCFHSVEGCSKIFSFTGNNNADGPFLYTGFKPAVVIGKCVGASGGWAIIDSTRNAYNVAGDSLYPNTADVADVSTTVGLDFLSNGIKVRSTSGSWNQSDTMLAIAFAESPFKYSNAR